MPLPPTATFDVHGYDDANADGSQGAGDRLTAPGTGSTIIVPLSRQGQDTINASVLARGDAFDLRYALAGATCGRPFSDSGGDLTRGASGCNALVRISLLSGGTPTPVAVRNGHGPASRSSFPTHAATT